MTDKKEEVREDRHHEDHHHEDRDRRRDDDLVTDLLDFRDAVISARLRVFNRFLDIVSDAESEWHEIPRHNRSRRRRRKILAEAVTKATDTVDDIAVPEKD